MGGRDYYVFRVTDEEAEAQKSEVTAHGLWLVTDRAWNQTPSKRGRRRTVSSTKPVTPTSPWCLGEGVCFGGLLYFSAYLPPLTKSPASPCSPHAGRAEIVSGCLNSTSPFTGSDSLGVMRSHAPRQPHPVCFGVVVIEEGESHPPCL